MTSVLIVEDHGLFGQGLAHALEDRGIATVVCKPEHRDDALQAARDARPDLVLLDMELGPAGTGLELIEPLREIGAIVVMLTAVTDRLVLAECIEAGADGLISKAVDFETLLDAIDRARDGRLLDPGERHEMLRDLRARRAADRKRWAPFRSLTAREAEVLDALGRGTTAAEIAESSFVSIATVRTQIRSVLVKLGVTSQLAAVARARQAGWTAEAFHQS